MKIFLNIVIIIIIFTNCLFSQYRPRVLIDSRDIANISQKINVSNTYCNRIWNELETRYHIGYQVLDLQHHMIAMEELQTLHLHLFSKPILCRRMNGRIQHDV